MEIKIIKEVSLVELKKMAEERFGVFVKGVVDVEQEIMAVGGEFHADEEVELMEKAGSKREHTWGINLWPEKPEKDWVEFDSMINFKPNLGNKSHAVENIELQEKIKKIVNKIVKR